MIFTLFHDHANCRARRDGHRLAHAAGLRGLSLAQLSEHLNLRRLIGAF